MHESDDYDLNRMVLVRAPSINKETVSNVVIKTVSLHYFNALIAGYNEEIITASAIFLYSITIILLTVRLSMLVTLTT